MNQNNLLKVFSGRANPRLAERIAHCLGDPLGSIYFQNFPDGEFLARIDENVRGRDVFVVQPTCHPVNENIMELLVILDSLKRGSARASRWCYRITVTPDRIAKTSAGCQSRRSWSPTC